MSPAAASDAMPSIGAGLRRRLAGFARILRDNGFAVGLAETRDALAILASPAAARPMLLRPALRALFCADRSDWQRFDEIFAAFWQGRGMKRLAPAQPKPGQHRPSLQSLAPSTDTAAQHGRQDQIASDDAGDDDAAANRRDHA